MSDKFNAQSLVSKLLKKIIDSKTTKCLIGHNNDLYQKDSESTAIEVFYFNEKWEKVYDLPLKLYIPTINHLNDMALCNLERYKEENLLITEVDDVFYQFKMVLNNFLCIEIHLKTPSERTELLY